MEPPFQSYMRYDRSGTLYAVKLRKHARITSALLSIFMVCGCVTRKIVFTSEPSSAVVRVGDRQSTIPCTLTVPKQITTADVGLPDGPRVTVALPESPGLWTSAWASCARVVSTTCRALCVPFTVVGLLGLASFGRGPWEGYLYGARQDGIMLEKIDATYAWGFKRLEGVLPPHTFGAYPGYSTSYNAGYCPNGWSRVRPSAWRMFR